MSAPVAPLGSLPSDKHRAVLEVYDAFRAVCFACRATNTNPTGKADPDEAKRRLDRLRYALVPFPDRRLYPDPFAALNNGRVRLEFTTPPPPGLDLESPDPVTGATSVHDATVRLAGRVYDLLLVVKLYERIDPETGERSVFRNYPYGYEREVVEIINGKPVKLKVTGMVNLPETEHYTAMPWTADLWNRLHELHAPELAAFAWSPAFNPHPGELRAELEREAALVPDAHPIGAAAFQRNSNSSAVPPPSVPERPEDMSTRTDGDPPTDPSAGALPPLVKNWLVAHYLADPLPDHLPFPPDGVPEPVVFVRHEDFTGFLVTNGIDLLPNLDHWTQAGWFADWRVDLRFTGRSTDVAPAHVARLQSRLNLPFGENRVLGIRKRVLDAPTVAVSPPGGPGGGEGAMIPRCGGKLLCSPDCGTVRRGDEVFTLTTTQRAVIRYMVGVVEERVRDFTNSELLEESGSTAGQVSNVFKRCPAWNALIVPVKRRKGFYRLKLE